MASLLKSPDTSKSRVAFLVISVTLLKSTQSIAFNQARDETGKYPFDTYGAIMVSEIIKTAYHLIRLFFKWIQAEKAQKTEMVDIGFLESFKFAFCSVCYTISNNIALICLLYIDPALFLVFGNLRIIAGGLMYWLIMGKVLTDLQWSALLIITFGATIASSHDATFGDVSGIEAFFGMMLVFIMVTISSTSNIWSERQFKDKPKVSSYWKNGFISGYALIITSIIYFASNDNPIDVFHGWNIYTWLYIVIQCSQGILISQLVMYTDTIVYIFITTISMLINSVICSIWFDFVITTNFVCAVGVITVAVYLYYRDAVLGFLQRGDETQNGKDKEKANGKVKGE